MKKLSPALWSVLLGVGTLLPCAALSAAPEAPAKKAQVKRTQARRPSSKLPANTIVSSKGYRITRASGWTVGQRGLMGADLVLMGPRFKAYRANLSVTVAPAPAGLTVDAARQDITDELKKNWATFKLLRQGYTTLGGSRALYTEANYRLGEPRQLLRTRQVVVIRRGTFYVFSCVSLNETYAANVAAFNKMLGSVRWTK